MRMKLWLAVALFLLAAPVLGQSPNRFESAKELPAGIHEERVYGICDFQVGGSPKVAEPAESFRGELARAMLYMAERYDTDVRMSPEELVGSHEADPPDEWETERARRILASHVIYNAREYI